jgi:hypothetical protein
MIYLRCGGRLGAGQVMKEHNIQLGLSPAPPIIPNVVKTFKEESTVSLLMHCSIISTLEHLLEHVRPLPSQYAVGSWMST